MSRNKILENLTSTISIRVTAQERRLLEDEAAAQRSTALSAF